MSNIEQIPLFPLGLVLLPFEELPLHIFEPRYKKMILNAINYNKPFGIVLNDSNSIYKIGCKAKVSKVLKTFPDGKSNIIVKGISRFEITKTFLEDQTIIGKVKMLIDEKINNDKLINEIHENYLKILLKIGNTNFMDQDLKKKISYEFIQNILLPVNIKKQLISKNDEKDRIKIINKLFIKILRVPFVTASGKLSTMLQS
mgnify:CR=1 FL=1